MQDGEAIEHKWVSKSIQNAQKRVEAHNFDIRKTLLEYDDISNEQRKLIYQQRDFILNNDANKLISTVCSNYAQDFIEINRDELLSNENRLSDFTDIIKTDFLIQLDFNDMIEDNIFNENKLEQNLQNLIMDKITDNVKNISANEYNDLIKNISLAVIDEEYRNHLSSMDYLRQSIGLRGYAQKNPKNEYKRESFEMFNVMLMDITKEILKICCRIKVDNYNPKSNTTNNDSKENKPNKFANLDISRNALCPCGSGKKYKRCCGKL